jgi:hypothetical protein
MRMLLPFGVYPLVTATLGYITEHHCEFPEVRLVIWRLVC